jgi:hypothetical protein
MLMATLIPIVIQMTGIEICGISAISPKRPAHPATKAVLFTIYSNVMYTLYIQVLQRGIRIKLGNSLVDTRDRSLVGEGGFDLDFRIIRNRSHKPAPTNPCR